MLTYILRRLLHGAVVVFGVSTVVFCLLRLTGDPTTLLLPIDATEEDAQRLRAALGLDAPPYVQYARFLARLARGQMGDSLRYGESALQLVLERLPATIELASAALCFALLLAVPVGILSATRRGSLIDSLGSILALLGQSMPVFWLGMMLILTFSVGTGWFPTFGRGSWRHLVLPAVTLGMYSAAMTTRLLRSSMLDVLGQDYVRTARAKGLSASRVILRHALRNALIPVITVVGLQTASLLGGSVVTETVFAWPGVGRLMIQSISYRDFPVVQAGVFVLAMVFIITNLLVDVLYGLIDPRIRYD